MPPGMRAGPYSHPLLVDFAHAVQISIKDRACALSESLERIVVHMHSLFNVFFLNLPTKTQLELSTALHSHAESFCYFLIEGWSSLIPHKTTTFLWSRLLDDLIVSKGTCQ